MNYCAKFINGFAVKAVIFFFIDEFPCKNLLDRIIKQLFLKLKNCFLKTQILNQPHDKPPLCKQMLEVLQYLDVFYRDMMICSTQDYTSARNRILLRKITQQQKKRCFLFYIGFLYFKIEEILDWQKVLDINGQQTIVDFSLILQHYTFDVHCQTLDMTSRQQMRLVL